MDNLVELNLWKNNLTKIESKTFQHLNKLKKLNLQRNQISEVDYNSFSDLNNLEEFCFDDNILKIENLNLKLNVEHY